VYDWNSVCVCVCVCVCVNKYGPDVWVYEFDRKCLHSCGKACSRQYIYIFIYVYVYLFICIDVSIFSFQKFY